MHTVVGPRGSKDAGNTGPQTPVTQQIQERGGDLAQIVSGGTMPWADPTVIPECPQNTLPSTHPPHSDPENAILLEASSSWEASRLEMAS